MFAQLGHTGGRQSAVVSQASGGLCSGAHVFGATGVASWRALFTSSVSMVSRTWVSGVVSRSHPAKIVPANPVGIWPCTRRDIRTVTSMWGDGSMTRGRFRMRAATPPGAG